jgi:hypothetical protein
MGIYMVLMYLQFRILEISQIPIEMISIDIFVDI